MLICLETRLMYPPNANMEIAKREQKGQGSGSCFVGVRYEFIIDTNTHASLLFRYYDEDRHDWNLRGKWWTSRDSNSTQNGFLIMEDVRH